MKMIKYIMLGILRMIIICLIVWVVTPISMIGLIAVLGGYDIDKLDWIEDYIRKALFMD